MKHVLLQCLKQYAKSWRFGNWTHFDFQNVCLMVALSTSDSKELFSREWEIYACFMLLYCVYGMIMMAKYLSFNKICCEMNRKFEQCANQPHPLIVFNSLSNSQIHIQNLQFGNGILHYCWCL